MRRFACPCDLPKHGDRQAVTLETRCFFTKSVVYYQLIKRTKEFIMEAIWNFLKQLPLERAAVAILLLAVCLVAVKLILRVLTA